eukprot:519477-Ditylum_brightwellii.AAC.1
MKKQEEVEGVMSTIDEDTDKEENNIYDKDEEENENEETIEDESKNGENKVICPLSSPHICPTRQY